MGYGPEGHRALLVLLEPLCISNAAAGGSGDRNRLLSHSTEPTLLCYSSISRGVPWQWGGQASAQGMTGGNSHSCVSFSAAQADCYETKQVFDTLSASALLLESKDNCSLPMGVKPEENLRPTRCLFRSSLWAISISLGGF